MRKNVKDIRLFGNRYLNASIKPLFKRVVKHCLSTKVNLAYYIFFLVYAKSISLCATFKSLQIIKGLILSSCCTMSINSLLHFNFLIKLFKNSPQYGVYTLIKEKFLYPTVINLFFISVSLFLNL